MEEIYIIQNGEVLKTVDPVPVIDIQAEIDTIQDKIKMYQDGISYANNIITQNQDNIIDFQSKIDALNENTSILLSAL